MDTGTILSNALNPAILFFFLGVASVLLKSDLEIPSPLPKLFSLYLLLVIGFKGGVELAHSGFSTQVLLTFIAAILAAVVVPIASFFVLRLKLDVYNAAAIAASYGSVSAVTFVTATTFLQQTGIPYNGYMVAALAIMESPAIVAGVLLVRVYDSKQEKGVNWSEVLREAFLNGSVVLLVGSLFIGLVAPETAQKSLEPFTKGIFYGVLTFFLLDMGLLAARRLRDLTATGPFLIGFGILAPVVNAVIAILIAKLIGMGEGNALLFAVLCASASYIAVPAAMRLSIPEANPSLYVSMALAITFPFNIIFGIPLYLQLIRILGV
ncbi:sodium-dependent bicarbonate transport family permease [Candidatus Cyanaurora vandensis]|uniref:sodium-dependent bicarbonate transport family permease n=1 Tax=Candidatus Cyanaurora vandensis TaxID=2714958 RepID=UPI00257B488E|nr:sodium-dependent bicarbonate transport family permease [Candidatus Cyanaurora vandensis]